MKNSKPYKVVFVPTQVFWDGSSPEVFRETRIFTLYELEKRLKPLKLMQTPLEMPYVDNEAKISTLGGWLGLRGDILFFAKI